MRKILIPIAAMGLVAFAAVSAMSQPFHEMQVSRSPNTLYAGGLFTAGKLDADPNIKGSHPSKGTYVIRFKKNTLRGSPMVTCTPYGPQTAVPICTVEAIAISINGVVEVKFVLYSPTTEKPVDGDFMFTEITI